MASAAASSTTPSAGNPQRPEKKQQSWLRMSYCEFPVGSTCLDIVFYDETSGTLVLTFDQGQIYKYLHVPKNIVCALLDAASKGLYFNLDVRNEGYIYQRLYDLSFGDSENCEGWVIINADGSTPAIDTILRNQTLYFKVAGWCCENILWELSVGEGSSLGGSTLINGALTAGPTACGTLKITATCPPTQQTATHYVRVTDAGAWVLKKYMYCAGSSNWGCACEAVDRSEEIKGKYKMAYWLHQCPQVSQGIIGGGCLEPQTYGFAHTNHWGDHGTHMYSHIGCNCANKNCDSKTDSFISNNAYLYEWRCQL